MVIMDQRRERLIDLNGAEVEIRDSYQRTRIVIENTSGEYELGFYEKKRSRKILEEICSAIMIGTEVFAMPKE